MDARSNNSTSSSTSGGGGGEYTRVAAAPKFAKLEGDAARQAAAAASLDARDRALSAGDEIEVELVTKRTSGNGSVGAAGGAHDGAYSAGGGEYPVPAASPGKTAGTAQGAVMGRGKQYLPLEGEVSEAFLDSQARAIHAAEEELQEELEAGRELYTAEAHGEDGCGESCISGRCLVYLCAVCSSLCSVLLGYDVGVMSGAKEYIQPDLDLTDGETAIIVGSLNLVAAFGALMAGKAADALGRRRTIALACAIFIAGAAGMALSTTFGTLLVGRVVTGVGVGAAMMVAPVYIAELAPADIRGALVSLTDISINLGILLGYGGAILFDEVLTSDSAKWRAMVGFGALPPALVLVCLLCMPESPRWLIARGDPRAGYLVLRRVLGDASAARASVHEMTESISHHAREVRWRDVLCPTDRAIAAAVSIGLGLGFWQQASGSEAAVYYSPEVLMQSGWSGRKLLLGNMAVGAFKLGGEVVAFFLLDRIGRRPLLITSAVTSTASLLAIALAFHLEWGGSAVLFLLSMFMLCFSIGLGPVTFVVASEVFPLAVRGKAMSLVVFINRAMSGIIALSYTAIAAAFTASGSFLAFAVVSGTSVLFYYNKVPETMGKTLEDITAELDAAARARPRQAAAVSGDAPLFQQRAGDIIL